jgi:hypothetical protein
MTDAPERIWTFDRYVNGVLMAEGVQISRAASFEGACVSAARLASRGPNGEVPVLVLASSPTIAALIAEARREERERAAGIAAVKMTEWARATYQNPDARMQNAAKVYAAGEIITAIRALKEETP